MQILSSLVFTVVSNKMDALSVKYENEICLFPPGGCNRSPLSSLSQRSTVGRALAVLSPTMRWCRRHSIYSAAKMAKARALNVTLMVVMLKVTRNRAHLRRRQQIEIERLPLSCVRSWRAWSWAKRWATWWGVSRERRFPLVSLPAPCHMF